MRYRQRAVVIEAVLWNGGPLKEVPEWLSKAIEIGPSPGGLVRCGDDIQLFTADGMKIAKVGDYIIRRENGVIHPLKPYVFEALYELTPEGT